MTLRDDLIREEGRIPYAYKDHLGFWTCGVGFLIDKDKGGRIPDPVIEFWLDYNINALRDRIEKVLPWIKSRSQSTQDAVFQMAYEMGLEGLLGFPKMLACLQAGDYDGATRHGLDSDWFRDPRTAERAKRVVEGFKP